MIRVSVPSVRFENASSAVLTAAACLPAMSDVLTPFDDAATTAAVIASTQRWLEQAVIGLNLCPFAKAVYVKRQIRYAVTAATTAERTRRSGGGSDPWRAASVVCTRPPGPESTGDTPAAGRAYFAWVG